MRCPAIVMVPAAIEHLYSRDGMEQIIRLMQVMRGAVVWRGGAVRPGCVPCKKETQVILHARPRERMWGK